VIARSLFDVMETATVTCPTCQGNGVVDKSVIPAVGKDHPATSHAAAKSPSNRVKFGSQRYRAMRLLSLHGPMTAAQIADQLGISRNQVATRLGECRELGWVVYLKDESGQRVVRKTSADSLGLVQKITSSGLSKIRGVEAEHMEKGH
jgi:hypothetical protein